MTENLPVERSPAMSKSRIALLLTGRGVSYLGDALTLVALPFAVFEAGGTVTDVGFVLAASRIVRVAFVLVGGVIADRVSRRILLITTDGMQGVAQAATGLLLLTGHSTVTTILLLRVLYGIGMSFFLPTLNGIIPQLVPPEDLQRANAALSLAQNGTSMAGPLIAGVLSATVGPGWVFAIDALTFVVSIGCVAAVPVPRTRPSRKRITSDIREGWTEFIGRPWYWRTVLSHGVWQFALAPFFVLGPAIAEVHLGGSTAWGIITSGMAAGGFLGGVLLLRTKITRPVFVANLLLATAALQLLALAAHLSSWLVATVVALSSVAVVIATGAWDTAVQRLVPNAVLSRLTSYDLLFSLGLSPLGFLVAGPVTHAIGETTVLVVLAVLLTVPAILVLVDPSVRRVSAIDRSTAEPQAHAASNPLAEADPEVSSPRYLGRWQSRRRRR